MSMKLELRALRRMRRAELETLHHTYVRTKRELKRAASPDRFIRRHLGVTIGAAAVAGMLLAPRGRGDAKQGRAKGRARDEGDLGGAGRMAGLKKRLGTFLAGLIPGAKQTVAQDGQEQDESVKSPPHKGGGGGMLPTLLAMALSRVDVTRLISEVMKHVSAMQPGRHHEGNGHTPDMSVADVGTVKQVDEDLL